MENHTNRVWLICDDSGPGPIDVGEDARVSARPTFSRCTGSFHWLSPLHSALHDVFIGARLMSAWHISIRSHASRRGCIEADSLTGVDIAVVVLPNSS